MIVAYGCEACERVIRRAAEQPAPLCCPHCGAARIVRVAAAAGPTRDPAPFPCTRDEPCARTTGAPCPGGRGC